MVVILIGGVLMTLGAFLPWERASAQLLGTTVVAKTANGTSEGGGGIVLVAGIVILALSALALTGTIGKKTGIATLVLSAIAVLFCFGNWTSIQHDIDRAKAEAGSAIDASIGFGLVLAVIGCLLVAATSILALRRSRATQAPPV